MQDQKELIDWMKNAGILQNEKMENCNENYAQEKQK